MIFLGSDHAVVIVDNSFRRMCSRRALRRLASELGRKLEKLVALRMTGERPGPGLRGWLEQMPSDLRDRLQKIGLLDSRVIGAGKPLREHFDDFPQFLSNKEVSARQMYEVSTQIRKMAEYCEWNFVTDISATQALEFLGELRRQGRSAQTFNHYLKAAKQFTRWLVRDRRAPENPLAHLTRLNVNADRRRERRALTADEFRRLVESAKVGPPIEAVPGRDRAMLYILAAWSGFRRKELASLTIRSFDLSADPPTVRVEASFSKNRRQDTVPLHSDVVELLIPWLGAKDGMPSDVPVFPLLARSGKLRKTSKMMQRDLERVGILYQDDDGLFADFHANRHTFISNLGKAGVPLATAQKLARHSDPKLTANVYTHLGIRDELAAVESLPTPPGMESRQPDCHEARATGTDGHTAPPAENDDERLTLCLPEKNSSGCISVHSDAVNDAKVSKPGTPLARGENLGESPGNTQKRSLKDARPNEALTSIPDWTRTSNLRLRRPTLYPIELRGQKGRCAAPAAAYAKSAATYAKSAAAMHCRERLRGVSTAGHGLAAGWKDAAKGRSEMALTRRPILPIFSAQSSLAR